MSDFLKDNLKKIGYEADERQCEQLNNFHKLLCEWNEFMNLTGITEYEDVVIKHYVDSLAINCVYS
ncbi:MAG: RsmG family class I SAM-dependent methyltransferase, partial [Lachnospiraceae bacterium]